MERAERGREAFRVGDLVVDVGLKRVTGAAGDITLPKLSFDLLLALVRRAPDYVSNDELASIVWAGVVVSPETVTKRVNLLREALGDDSAQPRYVAGLRSRGYRIVAPVTSLANEAPSPAVPHQPAYVAGPPAEPAAAPMPQRPRRWPAIVAALALVVIAGAAWFLQRERDTEPPAAAADQAIGSAAVAVLPFENLSASQEDAYLATGVPEMVQDRLAIVPGLVVIAGSSSGRAAGIADPKEMGRKLGARFLVLGSTQRAGDQLRVAARLVDTQSGAIVWSTRIDRPVGELFAVQDSIAASVTEELRQQLRGIASPPETARHQPPVEALIAYLQGRASLARHTVRGAEQAAERFERAVELDPGFAAALAGLYDARMLATERRHDDVDAARKLNANLIERALTIDPNCGPAYVARAIWTRGDEERQEADFTRGLALEPANGRGLVAYSEFLDRQGRIDEGAKVLDRAMLVDPLSPRLHFRLVMREFGRSTFIQTREPGLRHVLEIDPDYQPALQRYGKTKWMMNGHLTEAAQILEHAIETDPENPWSRQTAVAIYLDLGDEVAARQVADGTPSSRRTAQLLLALHDGDWRHAGEVAHSPAGQEYNLGESWGAAEAVRDYALLGGDIERGIEFFENRYALSGDEPMLEINNFRAAAYLAQLLRAKGENDRADALLKRLPGEIDASLSHFGAVFALRTKATVQLLTGDSDAAFATLRTSFAENDLTQWWYTLERDPLWQPFRSDPRFKAIDTQVRARVAQEAAALAELRRSGRIVDRSGPERNEAP